MTGFCEYGDGGSIHQKKRGGGAFSNRETKMLYDNRLSKIVQRLLWWYFCSAKNNKMRSVVVFVFVCRVHEDNCVRIETGA